jgi:microcystin-dependent protein
MREFYHRAVWHLPFKELANMSEPFVAEIRIFAGNFAPRGWAYCDGQLLPISQHTALFSLIGTTYGGDGRTTTALPNLKGRAPMHPGHGPGLTDRRLGQKGGVESVTLTTNNMPPHDHSMQASTGPASTFIADSTSSVSRSAGGFSYKGTGSESTLHESTLSDYGASSAQGHKNMQPFLTLGFIIALIGLYPSRD